ncbi:diguanylate cyclase [Glaciecola sp. XM2]|jgi:diguanylate cyclase (GGDEF)-like protein|uniref:sensor domain-containing diguanylate cyclase n=1 Tax=Glaciecola sp. XM2 TaxID=1914931 RepID=UPI001BDEB6EF|nr:sensor domain-containing diguanylate cyclase [Glaciecola sp. XM2]MBT1452197.1 diguanylate cyclase [Glaciecola sp. XM2]
MTAMDKGQWQQALLGSIEVGIVVVNKDFQVEEFNQFMENHSGVVAKDILGNSLFDFFKEIDQPWFENKCQPVFSMNTPVFVIWEQRQYLFKFGTSRPITSSSDNMYQNITILPITDDSGDVDKICILVYDMTDQAMSKARVEKLNEQLQVISRVDGLTGLYNRRYWQERFEREFKLTIRNKKPISVLMLDIDHFKAVNDTYGHQAGDKVIQSLAMLIKKATRETDICGRYGGEEFAILLPDTTTETAHIVGERIRKVSERYVVQHEGLELKFTVSVGIAEFNSKYTRPLVWLEAADQALYKAKESGRNKVIMAKP